MLIFTTRKFGPFNLLLIQIIQIFQKKNPRSLLNIIKLISHTCIFP